MLNLMTMFTFFCVRPKVPESTISVLNYNYLFYINLVPSLIWVCWWCQWLYTPFLFQAGSTLSEQIWSKKSRLFVLEMELGIYSNLIMLNSIVIFTFFISDRRYSFWASLAQKFKISCEFKWRYSIYLFLDWK